MGLECGAPRPQVPKERWELSKLDHGASMMPTQAVFDFLGHGLSACLDVKHAGCGMEYLSAFVSTDILIVEYQREVWQNMSGRMHVVSL